jgi:hypothetical protein
MRVGSRLRRNNKKHKKMKTRLSPGFTRMRTLGRVAFWTAMALAAVFLVSLFVGAQRPPTAPSISYSNHLDAKLAAGAPPPKQPAAPRPRAPKRDVSGLKIIPVVTQSGIKRVELLEKMPPEEGLMHVNFTVPASPAAKPEPTLGWGAWNQPPAESGMGPGGLAHIPGLAPVLTAASRDGGGASSPSAPGTPAGNLPGQLPGKTGGWHHGHFDGGMLDAHQHGRAHHKPHPKFGGR